MHTMRGWICLRILQRYFVRSVRTGLLRGLRRLHCLHSLSSRLCCVYLRECLVRFLRSGHIRPGDRARRVLPVPRRSLPAPLERHRVCGLCLGHVRRRAGSGGLQGVRPGLRADQQRWLLERDGVHRVRPLRTWTLPRPAPGHMPAVSRGPQQPGLWGHHLRAVLSGNIPGPAGRANMRGLSRRISAASAGTSQLHRMRPGSLHFDSGPSRVH